MQPHSKFFDLTALAVSISAAASWLQPILGCLAAIASLVWIGYQYRRSRK